MTTRQDLHLLCFLNVKRQIDTSKIIFNTSESAKRFFFFLRERRGYRKKNWIQNVVI